MCVVVARKGFVLIGKNLEQNPAKERRKHNLNQPNNPYMHYINLI